MSTVTIVVMVGTGQKEAQLVGLTCPPRRAGPLSTWCRLWPSHPSHTGEESSWLLAWLYQGNGGHGAGTKAAQKWISLGRLTDTRGAPLVCSLGSGSKTTIWEKKEGSWGVLEKPRGVVSVK